MGPDTRDETGIDDGLLKNQEKRETSQESTGNAMSLKDELSHLKS